MSEIAGKFADALLMFWQSLSDEERRALAVGAAWVGYMLVQVPLARAREERERNLLADALAERLTVRHG